MLLTVGFVVVALVAIGVVTDVSAAFLQRRSLAALADSAALAGAQVVDLDAYYAGVPDGEPLPLDRGAARQRVLDHLRRAGAWSAFPGLVVEVAASDGAVVTVRLRADLRPPLSSALGLAPGVARAEARATLTRR